MKHWCCFFVLFCFAFFFFWERTSLCIPGWLLIQNSPAARHWWLTPVILAIQEAEIRRSRFEVSLDK
jgi:hypothetical protein